MRIGLSLLCEQPDRKTGLTSLFSSFVRESLRLYDDVDFVVFCADGQTLDITSPRVILMGGYAANNRLAARLVAEHFRIGPAARLAGCDVLMTTGLVPVVAQLPVAMHLLTLHHLSATNRIGGLRASYRNWASRHGLTKAELVITNTRFACDQILTVDPKASSKLLQSYEGISHEDFHPRSTDDERLMLSERFGIKGRYFFWCSNFYPYKQAEVMMEAWCDLPQEIRESVPMVMVGGAGWGDSKDKTLEIAARRGAGDQVKMLGWVSDEEVQVLFRHAAVFVHPSREETFGRSVLEAMASGVPCVVQSIPVMHEVTGGHAVIIDFHDRAEAAGALETTLKDHSLRTRLIERGILRAKEFSFERLAAERIEAMRRLLKLPPGPHANRYPPVYADSVVPSEIN
jgi:O-antigen biosynthesis alpha-1,3-rhamnosyltransferase